ncbi:FKBP-type peptidyl-prolyl cis-trans isomerase [Elusimicrobium posterum]|uniref:FKBP-type peptidyl-prolyl cis-trans isomerase n=1 Tax=Elusimicrobium posterum TaxID=3116653 RepID=UPI003C729023
MKKLFVLSAGIILLLTACNKPVENENKNIKTGASMSATEQFIADFKKQPNVKELTDGILIQTIKEGTGITPIATDVVTVHYTGKLINGKVFDSSVERGEPAKFRLNQVISAWTKGVAQMRKGGKAVLLCPPATAYGDQQVGPIPANSTLVFEIELLDIN